MKAAIVDNEGNEVPPYTMGNLAIGKGWPAMMRGIWNNKQKYESYFMPGDWYVSGDSAYMDEDGYFWFQGRIDDVIMTSGERVGPFEVESKLIEHAAVAEAGVVVFLIQCAEKSLKHLSRFEQDTNHLKN